MIFRVLSVLSFLLLCVSVKSQSHYLLSKLGATRHDNRIIINWTIKQGGSCFGIGILRSTNNVDYQKIGEITGVCGSSESEQNFVFVDEHPEKNKIHYYVLELGFSGKSAPPLEAEYFDFERSKSLVLPNPLVSDAKIKFINPNLDRHTLLVFDAMGKFVSSQISESDEFLLRHADFISLSLAHIFIYTIRHADGKIISTGTFFGGN